MALPSFLAFPRHAIKIGLTQIDPAKTPARDPQFGEPTGLPVYKAEVILTALHTPGAQGKFNQRPFGDDPIYDGRLAFRAVDLAREAPGLVLRKGDRVTKLYAGQAGFEVAVNFHLLEVDPAAVYFGRPWLYVCKYQKIKSQAELVAP